MNFVARVEENLRDLGTEARRKHPGVKEASERAILTLRSCQTKYVAAVRRATSDASQVHPTTALFRSQDVLRPFLLAANYPDASARILSIALGGIELLLEGDAICEGDEKNIVRVLGIQAGICCVSLGRDEMASMGHQGGIASGVGAGVGAAGSAAAGAVGAVIGTGWGMFGGGGNKQSEGHSIGGGSGAADDLAGLSGGSHSTHSARTVREDEDVARRILKILVTITMSPALGMTEEVLAQCLTVCLMLLSCGIAECASTDAAVDAVIGSINSGAGGNRVRAVSRSGQTELGRGISQGTAVSSSSLSMDTKTPACRTRRAACSTLKKVILTLYERTSKVLLGNQGSEVVTSVIRRSGTDGNIDLAVSPAANRSPQQPKECSDSKVVHSLAVGAFLDLCALASPSSDFDRKYQFNASTNAGGTAGGASKWSCLKDTSGPLASALESGGASMGHRQGRVHAPSRATCMWILDSVLKERSDLFQPTEINDQGTTVDNILDDFPSLLQKKACPVISATLLGLCSDRVPLSRSDQLDAAPLSTPAKGRKEDAKSIVASSIPAPKDLAILMASTTLARTVINQYGSVEDSSGEIHTLVTSLVRFVVAATESIRDTEGFEDGYIYDRTEDGIMSASWASRGNADLASDTSTSSSSSGAPPRPKRSQRGQSLDSQMTSGGNDGNSWLPSSRQSPLPATLLWGAALSLEVLHNLLLSSWPVMKDLLTSVSEAASDLAVVGGSCSDSIRGVVAAAAKDSNKTPLAKLLVRAPCQEFSLRGKQLLSAFNEESDVISVGSKATTNASMGSGEASSDLVGDVVWIAYKCTLLIAESLETCVTQSNDLKQDLLVLIDGPFSPSLAAFQHFMKRLPGSKLIVARTVDGYSNMANALIPCASDTESIQRRALLTSLCKLSLPSWGDDEDGIPLEDHHVLCLEELFGIIHRHHNALRKDWYIVLCTLEYLSRLSISSPSLSEGALRKASFISSCLSRLSLFTTCLSEDSLQCFINSLADVSTIQSEKAFVRKKRASNVPVAPSRSGEDSDPALQQKDSAGMTGRLFSLAGRAFGGASDPDLKGKRDSFDSMSRARTSKTYDHDYRIAAYARLATTKTSIQNSAFQELPFCLVAITDVALYNLFRYKDYGPVVGTHLQRLVLSSISSEVRLYAIDSLTNIVTAQVSHSQESKSTHSTRIRQDANTLKNFLAVQDRDSALGDSDPDVSNEMQNEDRVSQADLLSPLCDAIDGADKVDVAEAGLQGIYSVLEGAGHHLANDAWLPLIRCIGALSGIREEQGGDDREGGVKKGERINGKRNSIDRSFPAWSSCSTLGFRCLKLIVDDFLDEIPREAETRSALLECCAAYGSSQHDVNTSLTSLGMLWTIADQDLTPEALDRVLAKLSLLAFDGRVEVRNCAVNTLFSCVVGLGDSLSPIQWRVCLSETLLGVLEEISSRGSQTKNDGGADTKLTSSGANPDPQSNRYKVTVHHSRDSSIKQWATTQVLALRGLERVLRQFFPQLLVAAVSTKKDEADDAEGWLIDSWARILDTAYRCAILTGGRDSLELRVVGTDLSVLCAQVSSKAGIAAANTPARVSTNMQVVNGALRSVNPSKKEQLDETNGTKVSEAEAAAAAQHRAILFRMAFDRVEELGLNLEHQSIHTDEEEPAIYVESTLLQVMTKFSGCLTALYDCCKDNEMSPPTLAAQREGVSNDLESKLAHVVGNLMKTAIGDPSSKYLTQAQRACLELLQTMSLRGSFVACEELGESAYCALNPSERVDGGGGEESEVSPLVASGTLQVECSKVVLELFDENSSADSITKLHVFDSILARSTKASIARYDLFIPIVLQGLGIIADTAEGREAENSDDVDLEDLWKRILTILSALLVPSTADSIQSYASNADDILSITNLCAEKLPPKFSDDLCDVLALGAESAAKVARKEINLSGNGKEANAETLRTNGLKLFQACFGALCSKQPNGSLLLSLSEQLLREAVDGAAQTASMKEHNRDDASVDVEVALFVCESIRELPNIEQVAIKLFPWLCKLTRSDSAALRTEAGTVLSSVDMVRVIEEAKAAEERAVIAELNCEKLRAEVKKLKDENEELRHQAMMGI